ncbi:curli-like amyloid fiber formation chaperone CsgH [Oceanicola sp. 22II-s10i]|uniref:curli-like amyloid fiber formation chaperone CsgH n=1 Tax=Oceanicola sp. 22II-s10i TaxID=1317116 RepID=UPI0026E298CD|nr:curli-like amyloid fiber formation chaperone CsgH [Oceanicola sp. 22II-s10i]
MLVPAPASAASGIPEIDVIPTETGYEVSGRVLGTSDGVVSARLSIMKSDKSGQMNTQQGKTVTTSAGSDNVIGRVNLSAGPDAKLDIVLSLEVDGRVEAEATFRLPGAD